jgi:hypothetical protein
MATQRNAVIAVLAMGLFMLPGCSRDPTVTSKESLTIVKALWSACSAKNPQWLDTAKQRIERGFREQKVSAEERDVMLAIVALGESGRWDEGTRRSRAFLEAQIGRGKPAAER